MKKPSPPVSMPIVLHRRDLLRGAVLLALPSSVWLPACSSSDDGGGGTKPPSTPPFQHGVASGDPLADAVILWTRISTAAPAPASVDVEWEVFEDAAATKKVASGTFATNADRDFTVKVDAKGLTAGTTYYYRFRAFGVASPIGRTRTAPKGATERLRLAVVSCASYAHGYFHTYRVLATQADLDAVLHLGDYIYEYGSGQYGNVREYEPATEILSLADYRTRHAYYKREANVQAVHRQHPFVCIWDDHEVANDAYKDGAENHTPGTEGNYADRKAAAQKAYREWMPIREEADGRIFRKLPFGDLVDLVMLDTRHWARSKQAGDTIGAPPAPDPTRTLLGEDQAKWLEDTLKASTAKWKLVGQQVMLGNLILGKDQLANLDQWHGYPESRNRFLTFLRDSGVKDVVVLTGDIHSSWANEICFDPTDPASYDPATGKGSLCVEIVTPAVTSPGIPEQFVPYLTSAKPLNPHIRWFDAQKRGFVLLDVTADRVQGAWFHFEDITKADPTDAAFAKAYSVKAGTTRLVEEPSAAPARGGAPALAT